MVRDVSVIERRTGRLAEKVGDDLLLAPLAMAFWRMRGAFERELGISPGMWFTLAILCEEEGISQGELVQKSVSARAKDGRWANSGLRPWEWRVR